MVIECSRCGKLFKDDTSIFPIPKECPYGCSVPLIEVGGRLFRVDTYRSDNGELCAIYRERVVKKWTALIRSGNVGPDVGDGLGGDGETAVFSRYDWPILFLDQLRTGVDDEDEKVVACPEAARLLKAAFEALRGEVDQ